ncbi:hypothetical protein UF31_02795, partial [Vibrio parahaemolyticus]
GVEQALGLGLAVDVEADGTALDAFVGIGRAIVRGHQGEAADHQPCVHDLVLPVGRDVAALGAGAERQHGLQGAAQVLVVAAEGLPAITVEDQVGDDLHGAFLVLGGVRGGSVAFFQLGAQALLALAQFR